MESLGNDLYAAWIDRKTSSFKLHVQKYDGTVKTWSYIDGSNGYKNRTSGSADFLCLYVYSNKMYLSW